ncbi:MAG: hypothetical protein U0Q18_22760 [Bryobacteraceae bacterium]
MNLVLGVATLVCLAVGVALVFLFRQLVAGPKSLPLSADWINALSAARYRPMERLLNEDEYRFLASQPGCDEKMIRRMRADRHRLFRGYLGCLRRDFGLLLTALKLLVTYSNQDRPDLVRILYKQQLMFATGMLMVEWRLLLNRYGLGSVDVSGLVQVVDSMRIELRQMVPASQPVGA